MANLSSSELPLSSTVERDDGDDAAIIHTTSTWKLDCAEVDCSDVWLVRQLRKILSPFLQK